MLFYACDICKKKIKDWNQVLNFAHGLNRASLCDKCSKPITLFLKKRGLIRQEVSITGSLKKKVALRK